MAVQCFVNGGFPVADKPCAGSRTATGFYSCCGPTDVCLDNKLCHRTNPTNGSSKFYTQSCSDQSFKDPACDRQCSADLTDDVVYNNATTQWACCGSFVDGKATCTAPTNETFDAPSPQSLLANTVDFETASSTSTSTSKPSSSASSTSTTTTPSISAPPSASATPIPAGLSPGAKAGIGIGAAVGALVLLLLLSFLIRWVMKRRGYSKEPASFSQPRLEEATAAGFYGGSQTENLRGGELPANKVVREMDGERPMRELVGGRPEMG